MLKVLILLAAPIVGIFGKSSMHLNGNWRVIGGSDAPEGVYPYQVSIRGLDGGHSCGGSIIKPNVILTAAHCVVRTKPIFVLVVVGSNKLNSGGTTYKVKKIIYHAKYDPVTAENDIALLKLSSTIEYTDRVALIALETEEIGPGVTVTLTGWGRTPYPNGPRPNNLQYVQLKTITNSECVNLQTSTIPIYGWQVCTLTKSGEGACHGDSGGPLATNSTLVGIVSWGTPCAVGEPDVFTRVSSYIDWIEEFSRQIYRIVVSNKDFLIDSVCAKFKIKNFWRTAM